MKKIDTKLPSKTGFDLPENYFEKFNQRLFSEEKTEAFPENTGYMIPNDYFKTFESKLMESLRIRKKKKIVRSLIASVSTIAAMFLLFFNSFQTYNSSSFEVLSSEEIQEWMVSDGLTIYSEIVSHNSESQTDLKLDNLSEKEIQEYLEETNPDLYQILN